MKALRGPLIDMRELIESRCPNHHSLFMLRQCSRCWRVFEEHTIRIAKLPPVNRS